LCDFQIYGGKCYCTSAKFIYSVTGDNFSYSKQTNGQIEGDFLAENGDVVLTHANNIFGRNFYKLKIVNKDDKKEFYYGIVNFRGSEYLNIYLICHSTVDIINYNIYGTLVVNISNPRFYVSPL
jgi:hypothetical protein